MYAFIPKKYVMILLRIYLRIWPFESDQYYLPFLYAMIIYRPSRIEIYGLKEILNHITRYCKVKVQKIFFICKL